MSGNLVGNPVTDCMAIEMPSRRLWRRQPSSVATRRPRRRHPDCCKMRARCFSVNWDCPPDTSPAGPCSRRPTDGAERRLTACRRPRRCIDSGRRLTMPSLACFEVALPLIAGQVSVDDGASLPSVGRWYLRLRLCPEMLVRVISQAPHRHRCPEPTLTCN